MLLHEMEQDSVLEMLYDAYRELNKPESDSIRANFSHLNDLLGQLSLQDMDTVWYCICDLCINYQKNAFEDGVRMGAKLMDELMP